MHNSHDKLLLFSASPFCIGRGGDSNNGDDVKASNRKRRNLGSTVTPPSQGLSTMSSVSTSTSPKLATKTKRKTPAARRGNKPKTSAYPDRMAVKRSAKEVIVLEDSSGDEEEENPVSIATSCFCT